MANENKTDLFFFKDNSIFFNEFAEIGTINNQNFKVIFDENNNNITINNFDLTGESPKALVQKCDFDRIKMKINDTLKIRDLNYLIKNIEKNTDGIYNLKLVEKD